MRANLAGDGARVEAGAPGMKGLFKDFSNIHAAGADQMLLLTNSRISGDFSNRFASLLTRKRCALTHISAALLAATLLLM